MKTTSKLLQYVVVLCALFAACRKSDHISSPSAILKAKAYFDEYISLQDNDSGASNLRQKAHKHPDWDKAFLLNNDDSIVVVPIKYSDQIFISTNSNVKGLYDLNDLAKLMIYKDPLGEYHTELITAFPDSNSTQEDFTGSIIVEDLSHHLTKKYKFEKDGKVEVFESNNDSLVALSTSHTVCHYIEGFNYSSGDPNGYHWIELVGCQTYVFHSPQSKTADYKKIGGGSGGGGGGGVPTILIPRLLGGNNIIGNIADYNKCFINKPGNEYSYQVSVCVAQPVPGSRTAWSFIGSGSSSKENPVFVGHAFLVLKQQTPTGTITRNIGFYPQSNVTPFSTRDQGQLNNDSQFEFDIALNIKMTNSQFFQILDFIQQGNNPGFKYDLNTNNCTTFLLNALSNGGINLPRTIGTWSNGRGCNPGDLGEDIRNLPLEPNMSRDIGNEAHPNEGNCY